MTTRQHVSVQSYNPTIAAYDHRWTEIYRKPLNEIEGMAYGVREDFQNGKIMLGGFVGNQCAEPVSSRVCFWSLVE